jgi:cation:H+ antiporter
VVEHIAFLCAGLALLAVGAEALVRGASRLAALLGVPPLVVGLTVVAWGTGAPELAVTVQASLAAQTDIAVGNVVGSNICNVLLILGLSAVVSPLVVSRQLVRRDVPVMIGVSVLVLLLALDGMLSRVDGLLLVALFAAYTALALWKGRPSAGSTETRRAANAAGAARTGGRQWIVLIGFILVGLALLVLGSRWLVDGAVAIAKSLGMSELIIGLTVVAVGTSMPEIATSVLAGIRGRSDIAVGNAVGSNIFNLLAALGVASIVSAEGIPVPEDTLVFNLPVMLVVALACLPIFFTGYRVARWEGALFLLYYAAFTTFLVLDALEHEALPVYSSALVIFALPVTGVTLLTLVVRAARGK